MQNASWFPYAYNVNVSAIAGGITDFVQRNLINPIYINRKLRGQFNFSVTVISTGKNNFSDVEIELNTSEMLSKSFLFACYALTLDFAVECFLSCEPITTGWGVVSPPATSQEENFLRLLKMTG